jgi:hypothetical protein
MLDSRLRGNDGSKKRSAYFNNLPMLNDANASRIGNADNG